MRCCPKSSLEPGCSAMSRGRDPFLRKLYLRKENAGAGGRPTRVSGAGRPRGTQGKRLGNRCRNNTAGIRAGEHLLEGKRLLGLICTGVFLQMSTQANVLGKREDIHEQR